MIVNIGTGYGKKLADNGKYIFANFDVVFYVAGDVMHQCCDKL